MRNVAHAKIVVYAMQPEMNSPFVKLKRTFVYVCVHLEPRCRNASVKHDVEHVYTHFWLHVYVGFCV